MSNNLHKKKILLIDDNYKFHKQIEYAFQKEYHIEYARDMGFGWNYLKTKSINLILLDLALKDEKYEDGLKRIAEIKSQYPNIPLIVVSNDAKRHTIVEATKIGADDFLFKGEYVREEWQHKFDIHLKMNELKNTTIELTRINEKAFSKDTFIGNHPSIIEIKEQLAFIGTRTENITVLITGETGVGKEVAVQYLHANSHRRDQPIQAIHLSAIQDTLLESTLFGHKKGSFTDAKEDRVGLFQQADKGILFLDEIGDVNLDIQIKLLRFLENRIIRPIGSPKDIKLDVQIVAATNKDLREAIEDGAFREDLYQRLNAFPIHIPPLRERNSDIELLLAHFLGCSKESLSKIIEQEALGKLLDYAWKGNIRELKNACEYMQLRKDFKKETKITVACLPPEIQHKQANTKSFSESPSMSHNEQMAFEELKRIEEALKKFSGKKSLAADELGKDLDGLRYKINKYFTEFSYLVNNFPITAKCYKYKK